MNVGQRIKQKRIELGLSQDALAKKVGYKSRSSIQKIECARKLPLDKVETMAHALECEPSYLMGWVDDTPEAKSIRDGYKRGFPVNGTEMLIIEHYRIADPDIQKAILKLLDLEYAFGGGGTEAV